MTSNKFISKFYSNYTCSEADSVCPVEVVLFVPAGHVQQVGGVLVQVIDKDSSVWWQEVFNLFGLV